MDTKTRTGYGTGEWAEHKRNCMVGCTNDCAYCYARTNAITMRKIPGRRYWAEEQLDEKEFNKPFVKLPGLIMFPTRHDITPSNFQFTLPYLRGWLEAGNDVLTVTKANLACTKELCRQLVEFKDQLLIRITIGSMNALLCKFWERNAPSPQERLMALQHAFDCGFETSVSMEPILHDVDDAIVTYRTVEPFVTEKIWIGPMNEVGRRVDMDNKNFKAAAYDIRMFQSYDELVKLRETLKDEPKVLWKETMPSLD